MSEDAPKAPVSLVSSFHASDYKHHEFLPFTDPYNPSERSSAMSTLRGCMQIARLTDYALLESHTGITVSLKNDADLSRFAIARLEDMEIQAYYFTAHPDYSTRSLRYRMRKLQEIAETSGFSGKLFFQVDADQNAIALNADCKKTYFDFLEFAKEQGLRAKLFKNVPLPPPKENIPGPAVMLEITNHDADGQEYVYDDEEDAEEEKEYASNKGVIDGGWNDQMQGPRKTAALSLVSDFHISDYIYSFTNALDDPWDGAERALVMRKFRGTVEIAGIKDYKLMEGRGEISLYLRAPEDVNRFNVVRHSGDQIEEEFVTFEDGFDFRKIKRLTRHLQAISDAAGFGDKILFGAARNRGGIVILGSPKKSYFEFADYVQANQDTFRRFFELQKKEPDLEIPTPTRQTAREPNIVVQAEIQTPQRPPSDLFIRGGATQETATAPAGEVSLVKSMTELNYPWKLTPVISIDPSRNTMDRLCRDLPDYEMFKLETKGAKIMMDIRNAMEGAGVDDYSLHTDRGRIEAHFKHPRDLAIAYASLYPSSEHLMDFVECSQNASPMKMHTKAKKLQAIFNELGADVTFICDMQRKVIKAHVTTTDGLIAMQGIARKLETSSPVFQRIVGLN